MKFELSWTTDENGMLLGARVHDSQIIRFMFAESVGVQLEMRRSNGEMVALELSGLTNLNVVSLWSGAIVSEIFVWEVGSVPEICWDISDSAWNVLFAGQVASMGARKAEAEKIAHNRPGALLVQLACSYGGTFAAVCDRVAVYEVGAESVQIGTKQK
jgi:hypothetical protein